MTHTSATPYQLWSVLAVVVGIFFFRHIYKFDRFQCFRWNQNGSASFKRFMIYSYTLSLPCVLIYAVGFAVIKSLEGNEIQKDTNTSIPKEAINWTPAHQKAILPLYFVFAIGWALEITTHLEELCFWTFLLNSRGVPGTWVRTIYFKLWTVGSVIAFVLMITINVVFRNDSLKCEAFTYFSGSIYGMLVTVGFLPILFRFPSFLRKLKNDGIDKAVIIRLTRCHELNTIRVFFRFFFLVPLLILAVDGLNAETSHINRNVELTDLLAIMAGVGGCISSILTVLIFFPRSIEAEMQRDEEEELARITPERPSVVLANSQKNESTTTLSRHTTNLLASPPKGRQSFQTHSRGSSLESDYKYGVGHHRADSVQLPLTMQNLERHTQMQVNPMVGNFSTPFA